MERAPPHADAYRAPVWLPGGHLQTIYTSLFISAPQMSYRRERLELTDGDFLDFDWVDGEAHAPVVVLFHGLEGDSASGYARRLMHSVQARGWQGVVAHFRGTSGEDNRLPRAYFAGDSEEIERMLRHVKAIHPTQRIYAVGVSLGGNALLKWLGENGPDCAPVVDAAAAVSAPLDLAAAGTALDSGFNRHTYVRHFLSTLRRKALDKIAAHRMPVDPAAIRATSTLRQFDDIFTAPLHGFRNADDYWARASSKPWLNSITVPTLLINARNDPFLPASALPSADEVSAQVIRDFPDQGGHVGFVGGPFPGTLTWLPERVLNFFDAHRADARVADDAQSRHNSASYVPA